MATGEQTAHKDALALIARTNIAHPGEALLRSFVDTAFDPHRAAEYFLGEVNSNYTTSSEVYDKFCDFLSRWVNLLQQCR